MIEKGIFGGGIGGGGSPITWNNIFYNQLLVSPWACFYMANFTALSNMFNVSIPIENILQGWKELVADGKFIPKKGGRMSDGYVYALKIFNEYT